MPAPSEKDINLLRNSVRTALSEASTISKSSHKPLLILVGEAHTRSESSLMSMIIYDEARKLGVRDFALELPEEKKATDPVNSLIEKFISMPITHDTLWGHSLLAKLTDYNKDRVHLVDERHAASVPNIKKDKLALMYHQLISDYLVDHQKKGQDLTKSSAVNILNSLIPIDGATIYCAEERNEAISRNLSKIHNDSMMLTGSGHLPGLLKNAATAKEKTVIAFDVSGWPEPQKPGQDIITLTLPSDVRQMPFEQLFSLAMEKSEVPKFLSKYPPIESWSGATSFQNGLRDASLDFAIASLNLPSYPFVPAPISSLNILVDTLSTSLPSTQTPRSR